MFSSLSFQWRLKSKVIPLVLLLTMTLLMTWYASRSETISKYRFLPQINVSPSVTNMLLNIATEKSWQLIAVHTGFYYKTSILYPNNTVALLFFGDVNFDPNGLVCNTANAKTSMNKPAEVRSVAIKTNVCRWTAYVLTCSSVKSPTKFTLSVNKSPSNIMIPLELPHRKPKRIVAFYAPMFYEQRWQAIAFIHEVNAGFGVDLQVHYVQSVVGELLKLLDPLVKKKLLELRGFDILNYDIKSQRKFGYNPAQETEARNQVMALQDCYFRYRESAEFIIISDLDDWFIPFHGKNLYSEFSYWKRRQPMASAYTFVRNKTHISTSSTLDTFSISKTLHSAYITTEAQDGKSVYNPKYAETPWLHWPGLNNTPTFNVPVNESCAIHLFYKYDEPPVISKTTTYIGKIVNVSKLDRHTFIDYDEARKRITDLASPQLEYATSFKMCMTRIFQFYQIPLLETFSKTCTTPTSCDFPVRNVTCTVAVRNYRKQCTKDGKICALLPKKVLPDYVKRSNGCKWGVQMAPEIAEV